MATRRHGFAVAGAVFVSGAVVLGMEIAASRVLAPFFGNSLFVWGSLIGIVLAVLVGLGFFATYAARGDVLPGAVGGILAAVLVYVVILRFEQQSAARRRDRR